jgi:hypothetical protein
LSLLLFVRMPLGSLQLAGGVGWAAGSLVTLR